MLVKCSRRSAMRAPFERATNRPTDQATDRSPTTTTTLTTTTTTTQGYSWSEAVSSARTIAARSSPRHHSPHTHGIARSHDAAEFLDRNTTHRNWQSRTSCGISRSKQRTEICNRNDQRNSSIEKNNTPYSKRTSSGISRSKKTTHLILSARAAEFLDRKNTPFSNRNDQPNFSIEKTHRILSATICGISRSQDV